MKQLHRILISSMSQRQVKVVDVTLNRKASIFIEAFLLIIYFVVTCNTKTKMV